MPKFQIAGGSIMGGHHKRPLRTLNAQDSFYYEQATNTSPLVAVVCDGCGAKDCPHSEVGAKIATRIITRRLQNITSINSWSQAWIRITSDLRLIADQMVTRDQSFKQIVNEFFLFTIVGVVMFDTRSVIFTRGDGLYAVNGEVVTLSNNNNNNAPDYIGYHLTEPSAHAYMPEADTCVGYETDQIESIILATDGAHHFLGTPDKILNDPYVWSNPDQVGRILQTEQKNHPEHVTDDATLVVIRQARP